MLTGERIEMILKTAQCSETVAGFPIPIKIGLLCIKLKMFGSKSFNSWTRLYQIKLWNILVLAVLASQQTVRQKTVRQQTKQQE